MGGYSRALTRKSFSPNNKISVKFCDDVGTSEGAVDVGGTKKGISYFGFRMFNEISTFLWQ